MLKIAFDNFKNGWINFILSDGDFHFESQLSTIGTYQTPEFFFESVIELILKKETYIKLDKESYQDYLFLAPTENNTFYWMLCKPNGKDFHYIDYLTYSKNKSFTPYIIDFMQELDSDLTILNTGISNTPAFCLDIYNYFRQFTTKNGLIVYKEKALINFNVALFKKMEKIMVDH